MKYMLLIYEDEQVWERLGEAGQQKIMGEYWQFTSDIKSSGHYESGAQLYPSITSTNVRLRDGKRLHTDGPFAETREQLGGYYLVNAKDLDEAISIAERIPSAREGSIEIRPLIETAAPAST